MTALAQQLDPHFWRAQARQQPIKLTRLLGYLWPHRSLGVVTVVSTILMTLTGLLTPWPLKILLDSALGNHPLPAMFGFVGPVEEHRYGVLVFAVLAGLAVTLVQNAVVVLDDYVTTRLKLNLTLDFRSDLFEHAQRLSLAFHDRRRSGGLIYAINFMAEAPAQLIMSIPGLAYSALTLVGMLVISLMIDAELALLSLIIVPFLYYSIGYYVTRIQTRLYQVKLMEGETLSIIHEAMSMMGVIVAFVRESHEHRRFRDQGARAVDARVKITVRQTLFSLAVNSITAMGSALVLGVGAYHVLEGQLTVGELLVVMSYIASVYAPLKTISTTVGSLQDQLVSVKMSYQVLDTRPEVQDAPDAVAIQRAEGRVVFEDVRFGYDRRHEVLKGVSFEVHPGQVVALVGPTGVGKTTVVSLIPRFYEPQQGRVLIDGTDIRKFTLASLRQQISIVLQEPLLFAATIADNIRYGRLDATDAEVIEAARAANAHDFITRLDKGYQTTVGERGARLSGGERQRIAMARAFLKNAPILLLDEPTSAIDTKTEAVILDALGRLMVGRTTFVVAHRLSTVRKADVVFVMQDGRIVERGSHDELFRLRGLYRQLFDLQIARQDDESEGLFTTVPSESGQGTV